MNTQSSNIYIVALISPKPAHYETGLRALRQLLAPTRAEAGCIQFDLFEDPKTQQYVLVEEFKSQAAIDFHYAQDYTKAVLTLYESILEKEPEIHYLNPVTEEHSGTGNSLHQDA